VPFMYCDPPTTIAHIQPATDETHVGHGTVKLTSGAQFQIGVPYSATGPDEFLITLRKTDHIQLCYAPTQKWADAGATARMAIVGDVESGKYTYTIAYPKSH